MTDVIVVGGGVIGLSCAWELARAGKKVEVWAAAYSPHTTSDVAAALWYPYKAGPEALVKELAIATLDKLIALAAVPESGVRLVPGRKVFHRPMGKPWWSAFAPQFRVMAAAELGEGLRAGYAFHLPCIDMSIHLPYLQSQLQALGVGMHRRTLESLAAAQAEAPVVIHCSGLGARSLVGDGAVFPIRGQVVLLEGAAADEIFLDSDHPDGMIYVIPRRESCILGGVAEDQDFELGVRAETAQAILGRGLAARPELRERKVLGHRVGLRPGRPEIRLEVERNGQGTIIHNYGHGGSGVTLALGAAEWVRRQLD